MDRHQPDLVPGLRPIQTGEQSDMGQILFQRVLLAAGVFKIVKVLFQFCQVVQPCLAALGAQSLLVTALV